ncbi:hypothetical protein MX657_03800 [Enterobacter chuandaensis]|uniref:hypothetical protein n=1 Tax=Enterobacter chuandaensis TaxID=2497875 RepID=UPI00321773C5
MEDQNVRESLADQINSKRSEFELIDLQIGNVATAITMDRNQEFLITQLKELQLCKDGMLLELEKLTQREFFTSFS